MEVVGGQGSQEARPFICLEGIYKSFTSGLNRVEVLKGLDLEVFRGERLAIMGASGVGKSTLLNIMGGLERPTSGRVLFGEVDLSSLNDRDLSEFRNKKVGFVFQFHHLLAEFDALENCMMPALIGGMERKEAKAKAEEILKEVGLAERLSHRPGELSGGEQQRVAVARALVLEPSVLLADEPTGNLDVETGREVANILVELNVKKGVTLVVVTHNIEVAGLMGKQVGLVQGKAVAGRFPVKSSP